MGDWILLIDSLSTKAGDPKRKTTVLACPYLRQSRPPPGWCQSHWFSAQTSPLSHESPSASPGREEGKRNLHSLIPSISFPIQLKNTAKLLPSRQNEENGVYSSADFKKNSTVMSCSTGITVLRKTETETKGEGSNRKTVKWWLPSF